MKTIKYGSSWKSNSFLSANVAQEVISPAANARGAWIWFASLQSMTTTAHIVAMVAKTSAPASAIDGDILLPGSCTYNGTNDVLTGNLGRAIFLPPGRGLYFISSNTENTNGNLRTVLYDLL